MLLPFTCKIRVRIELDIQTFQFGTVINYTASISNLQCKKIEDASGRKGSRGDGQRQAAEEDRSEEEEEEKVKEGNIDNCKEEDLQEESYHCRARFVRADGH